MLATLRLVMYSITDVDVASSNSGANGPSFTSSVVQFTFFETFENVHVRFVLARTVYWRFHIYALYKSTLALFKSAYITPRLKKASLDSADTKSYRPISNLPVLSKTLERLVAHQLVEHLDLWRLLTDL